MKKEYVLLMMLLIGLLIPMTIASKSIDYDILISEPVQPLKIKFICLEEVGTRNILCIENQAVIAVEQKTAGYIYRGKDLDNIYQMVRYQADLVELKKYAVTNYIRYL